MAATQSQSFAVQEIGVIFGPENTCGHTFFTLWSHPAFIPYNE
jgi:hypothetical protein